MASSTNCPNFPYCPNFRSPVTGDGVGNPPPHPPPPASKPYVPSPESYALSGKIMLSAIIILFVVVLLIVCLHVYARWFLTRSRHRRMQHNRRRRHRRTHLVFTMDISPTATSARTRGLDSAVLKSLPTFNYSSTVHDPSLECAVCLSEFVDNEKGRLLPKCNHSFHTECIDMWFKSHSTCPLCRAPVNLLESPKSVQIVIDSAVSTSGPTSDPETTTTTEEGGDEVGEMLSTQAAATSSSSNSVPPSPEMGRRKMEVSIEIPPRRNESFKNLEEESGLDSLSGRIRSFKRMLSRDRKPISSPMSCGGSGVDFDLERGGGDIAQEEEQQTVITPRPVSQ